MNSYEIHVSFSAIVSVLKFSIKWQKNVESAKICSFHGNIQISLSDKAYESGVWSYIKGFPSSPTLNYFHKLRKVLLI